MLSFTDVGLWRESVATHTPDGPVRPQPPLRPKVGRQQIAELDGERVRGCRELKDVELGLEPVAEHQQEGFLRPQRT